MGFEYVGLEKINLIKFFWMLSLVGLFVGATGNDVIQCRTISRMPIAEYWAGVSAKPV
jgi:hypothetical protein